MMDVVMRLPDVATTGSAVTVVRWLVDVGEPVRRGQPLLEIMTDKAVVQLDQMTQQNAALVEEASAASKSMASRSQTISDMLERYRLGQEQSRSDQNRGAGQGTTRNVA